MNKPLWSPSSARIKNSHLYRFIHTLQKEQDLDFTDYKSLHQWSIENSDKFWKAVWNYTGVTGSLGPTIQETKENFETCGWFTDSTLNFAENLLRKRDDTPAIITLNEQGQESTLSWNALYTQVAQVAQQLHDWGFGQGDVAAGYLPNRAETVIAMLAVTALGGVWSVTSPDFGFDSVYERFSQIQPKILFCCTQTFYAGKYHDRQDVVTRLTTQLTRIEHVVVLDNQPLPITDAVVWRFFNKNPQTTLKFTQFPAENPLYILYSSGTTGKPKCIVHRTGGILLQHLKEHQLHCDIQEGDKVFYYTTCGWMMWNWLVSSLASSATLVLYDGSPAHPDLEFLWHTAQRLKWSLFGTSARYIETLRKQQVSPKKLGSFPALKTICSTGSSLSEQNFAFVYQHIKNDVHLASISGGTDLCSCFALGNPISPVFSGQLQGAGLGMAVDVVDEAGQSINGESGELVCRQPFPAQPLGFFGDAQHEKYHNAYFARFKGMWCQGDWVVRTQEDGFIFQGRSDATLNPSGVRIGTAEIYKKLSAFDEIEDSLVVGQAWQGCQRIVLYVQLTENTTLDKALIEKIKTTLHSACSPRHVPEKIIQVSDMPRTKSGKLVEVAVRNLINKRDINNLHALSNPEVLSEFYPRPELDT